MADILLVLSPQQQGSLGPQIKKQLRQLGRHTIQEETNRETGLELLTGQPFDYIIVGSQLADDAGAVVAEDGGLAFCREVRVLGNTPMMLLAPAMTTELNMACIRLRVTLHADPASAGSFALELLGLESSEAEGSGAGGDAGGDAGNGALAGRGGRARVAALNPCLDIRVSAIADNWRFEMHGIDFQFQGAGPLTVSKSARLDWQAQYMHEPDWYKEFSRIGKSIRIALCEDQESFRLQRENARLKAFQQLGEAGKDVTDRITFEVSEDCYPLLLEAMFEPSQEVPWLAKAASMSRRLAASKESQSSLFAGPVAARRALLICADTHGTAYDDQLKGGALQLAPLTAVRRECARVKKLLTRPDPRSGQPLFHERNVSVIGLDGPLSRESLVAALGDGGWDLIHFAGHTCFQPAGARQLGGTGFLFVGPKEEPQCVDFGDILSYLRDTRFVYLSSCESGNSGFATLAAEAGIHAVLGYRCRVNDRTAAVQALLFYRMLQRSRSLDAAFGHARRRLYRRYEGQDNAWASAMLVTSGVPS
ncbi:CHAT domain-containing protein [Roseateles sp. UC29_93]|uniref:CHAT domain-containing protein n=1 Tax=Roseateles sp. UC29_93 TaxID=3350177 RepID=UPI003672AB04